MLSSLLIDEGQLNGKESGPMHLQHDVLCCDKVRDGTVLYGMPT